MKKFTIQSSDPTGKDLIYGFTAKDFKTGIEILVNLFGAINLKSHDPVYCKDAIRSWEFEKEGLHWNVEAGPAPKE